MEGDRRCSLLSEPLSSRYKGITRGGALSSFGRTAYRSAERNSDAISDPISGSVARYRGIVAAMTYYKVCLVFTVASISANAHAPRQSWLLDGTVDSHAAATSDLIPLTDSRSSTGQQSLVTAKDEKSKPSSAVVPLAINWTTSKSSQAEKGTKKKKKKKQQQQQQRTEVAGTPPAREIKLPVSFAKSGKVARPLRFRRSDWRRNSNVPSLPDSDIFAEQVFADSLHETPARYKRQAGNCRKIVRDSMVCTSCTDPKTNGKYEQCSYVAQPKENAYAYSKRSSFGEPATSDKVATPRKQPEEFADQLALEPDEGNSSDDPAAETSGRDAAHGSSKCEVVQRDSKTCTVCIDPKSGGNYEKCSYAYQPNDKLYKFSRSKSFGYPDSATRSDDRRSDRRSDRRTDPGSGSQLPTTSEASETPLEGGGGASDCRQIKRDSMMCSVCRDAKTGGNSETCSYSYQPNDKLFSYSKASSFGSPSRSESDDSSSESSGDSSSDSSLEGDSSARIGERRSVEESHEEHAPFPNHSRVLSNEPHRETNASQAGSDDGGDDFFHAANNKAELKELMREFEKQNRSQCETTMRDGMTCYRCVDEKGFRKEECMFVAEQEPSKDRVAYREMKEFQLEPISSTASIQRRRRVDKPIEPIEPAEPIASPSDESYARAEPNEHGASGEPSRRESHDTNEAEPYEYSAETRPVYDKVLGLTLPAYMLATSEHEAEFDEIVASASS